MLAERRVFLVGAELRAASDGKTISGYAARYNTLSQPLPAGKGSGQTFRERIAKGAFRNAVKSGQDVTMLVQHDPDKLLGRTASGTLKLKENDNGLQFRCSMPDTQLGHDTHEMIKRGDLNACSFGFMLGDRSDDSWEDEELEEEDDEDLFGSDEDDDKKQKRGARKKTSRQMVRTIHNVRHLYDVSVVTRAAYPKGTCVQARGIELAYPELPAEIRSAIEAAESTEERLVREFGADKVIDAALRRGKNAEAVRSRRRNLLSQV
jgi:HK97 family phage prohead protease